MTIFQNTMKSCFLINLLLIANSRIDAIPVPICQDELMSKKYESFITQNAFYFIIVVPYIITNLLLLLFILIIKTNNKQKN